MKRAGMLMALSLFLSGLSPFAPSAEGQSAPKDSMATGIAVRADGLVATWYPPASGRRGPAILVLGGSEGGEASARRIGAALAGEGYGVLALAWFRAEGLPPQLQRIPLEYFGKALDWLAKQPLADPGHIGLYGVSKGGEAALLIAAHDPRIAAVIAAVPSSVVWPGINTADYTDVQSSFSLDGKPVPYLPYDFTRPFISVFDLYARSLTLAGEHPDAAIPVERIAGAVLLLSARGDTLWPSSAMSDQVMARLDAKGFRHRHQHIAYPDTGHGGVVPAGPGEARNSGFQNMGGTEAGNGFARRDAWARMIAFYRETLGAPR